ncbi:MAG: glycosyltransferase family 39 protein [Actinomycetota bacterium]|nr:glycosyltransferase family 39 protein [Actinomycetota bacterium]
MSRRVAYSALAFLCAAPRIGVLLHVRNVIMASNAEKSDLFAQLFVAHGTYGLLPGEPSAYTQPLYGWFLIPVYWVFGRAWWSVGIAQILLAVVTAWLVYEIGRRVISRRAGLVGAAIATLNPYLIWHDVHVNREIVDQVCAAALVLLTLMVAEKPSRKLAALLGVVTGLALLGNSRLVFVPILCAVYLTFRLPRARASAIVCGLVLVGAGVMVAPWLIRNKLDVGCWAITTDGRAMWKANNPRTYGLLSSGQWIDNVDSNVPRPPEPGHLTPDEAHGIYVRTHHRVKLHPDECLEMTFYENQALDWMRDHPGDKAKLAALSAKLLWQPSVFETSGRPGAGTNLDVGRRIVEPVYMWILYALAFVGLFVTRRAFVALALALFAYNTAAALLFVGATRYRVAWDFLLAILAAAALGRLAERVRSR